jgi:hypothetical protein
MEPHDPESTEHGVEQVVTGGDELHEAVVCNEQIAVTTHQSYSIGCWRASGRHVRVEHNVL